MESGKHTTPAARTVRREATMSARSSLDRMRLTLGAWLKRNGLAGDAHFWTAQEWRARREEDFSGAHLVLTFEGDFFVLVNYFKSHPRYAEFDLLITGFGYYAEQG